MNRLLVTALLPSLIALGSACSSDDDDPENTEKYVDPGTQEWAPVARDRVAEECRLDPALLEQIDGELNLAWGIVRYGKLCHEFYPKGEAQITERQENFSATKTLGATVVGIAAHETRNFERSGRKTGPISDLDRVDHWLDEFTFNKNAHLAHVLGMVGHNADLGLGKKVYAYDAGGTVQINRLSDIVNTAIAQDSARLGANIEEFTQRFLYEPLGMRHSVWTNGEPNKNFAFTWQSPLRDMMRLGLLLLNDGVWNGKRVLGSEWVYRMTHPSFEDANTGYGYLTWLQARSNWMIGIASATEKIMNPIDPCQPAALHREYPHGLSESPDCNYADGNCSQKYDVGVWHANGLNGQLIVGMKGLDMVLVVKDFQNVSIVAHAGGFWPRVRRAVIALDPKYAGDEAAFCEAYGNNDYAPDLR
ncbi:MAG TPA: hypothetical protein VK524_26795 [Polyangiaceae bacterium]|nr:hypothetical protein [Polyangiaceae bacterium]